MNTRTFTLLFSTLIFACLMALSTPAISADTHSGVVKETTDAGGYTYMLVENDGKEQWVAIPQTPVKVGNKVNYIHGVLMENFGSKTLNKTFDEIIFSEGLTTEPPATGKAKNDMFASALEQEKNKDHEMSASAGSGGAVAPFMDEKVEKAKGENSYTVEELFGQREQLSGQTITVRGKVMKINQQIMGRNWIHLQDGTGNPMNNTHDLVITSSETPAEGVVVTMQGKVAINQDFGFSYQYDLLIEEAKVVQ